MRCPFTLFKKKTGIGLVWYVRFWNEKAQKYSETRSTGIIAEGKKERKREAELKANEMLSEIRFETDAADCLFLNNNVDFIFRYLFSCNNKNDRIRARPKGKPSTC